MARGSGCDGGVEGVVRTLRGPEGPLRAGSGYPEGKRQRPVPEGSADHT